MRLPRPKSLSGLMLIGFTIVAAPLLFAIVNAAVQMNRLSIRSQQLVAHGMQGTRSNQRMFEEIEALALGSRWVAARTDSPLAGAAKNAPVPSGFIARSTIKSVKPMLFASGP